MDSFSAFPRREFQWESKRPASKRSVVENIGRLHSKSDLPQFPFSNLVEVPHVSVCLPLLIYLHETISPVYTNLEKSTIDEKPVFGGVLY